MRFRPANISVLNRRRSFSIGYSLCPHPTLSMTGSERQLVTGAFSFFDSFSERSSPSLTAQCALILGDMIELTADVQ